MKNFKKCVHSSFLACQNKLRLDSFSRTGSIPINTHLLESGTSGTLEQEANKCIKDEETRPSLVLGKKRSNKRVRSNKAERWRQSDILPEASTRSDAVTTSINQNHHMVSCDL